MLQGSLILWWNGTSFCVAIVILETFFPSSKSLSFPYGQTLMNAKVVKTVVMKMLSVPTPSAASPASVTKAMKETAFPARVCTQEDTDVVATLRMWSKTYACKLKTLLGPVKLIQLQVIQIMLSML